MAGPRPLVLLWGLLTLCISTGTSKVWVHVQMEATEIPTFTVHCGILGPGFISLVTVNWGGPDGAGGTSLAVLHPEFGTQQWAPARQARWETNSSVSLTLAGSEARSPRANTTFCCKFVSFPNGSQEACGDPQPSSDQGLSAPTPAPMLWTGVAGVLGGSVLLCGCILVLHLLRRQRHRSVVEFQLPPARTQTQRRARAAGQASLPPLQSPSTLTAFSSEAPDMVHPHQQLSRWAPLPIHTAHQPQAPARWASLPASMRSSFVSVENGLYTWTGERPPSTCLNLTTSPDPPGPRTMKGRLGVR